jgi:hypothetical protein
MTDDMLRKEMSHHARNAAKKISTDKVAANVVKLYRKVLEERPVQE